jgi:hypothetical protein
MFLFASQQSTQQPVSPAMTSTKNETEKKEKQVESESEMKC